jgi:hypothetical protein
MNRRQPTIKELKARAPTDPEQDEFNMRLGTFIELFANVETELLLVVKHYAKIDADIARAILSPLRVEAAINHLHRIIEVRRLRSLKVVELEEILTQLAHINKARNDVLHMGFIRKPGSEQFIVSNVSTAHARRVVRRRVLTQKVLLQMSFDLVTISMLMLSHLPDLPHPEMRKLVMAFRRRKPVGQPFAWLYKSPPQAKNRPKRRVRPQARRARPAA